MGMILEGSYELNATPDTVWEFIIDPARISKCFPDLKTVAIENESKFTAVVRAGVGPIRTDFKFRIEITGKEPPRRVQLKAAGYASGSTINLDVAVEINQVPGGSQLVYKSDVKVGGMMAGLGQRVITDAASKTVASVFSCVKKQVEHP